MYSDNSDISDHSRTLMNFEGAKIEQNLTLVIQKKYIYDLFYITSNQKQFFTGAQNQNGISLKMNLSTVQNVNIS